MEKGEPINRTNGRLGWHLLSQVFLKTKMQKGWERLHYSFNFEYVVVAFVSLFCIGRLGLYAPNHNRSLEGEDGKAWWKGVKREDQGTGNTNGVKSTKWEMHASEQSLVH